MSALLLFPLKSGGSLPIALTFAAVAIGCAVALPVAGGPPPPGVPRGSPPVPPPHSPIAILRSSSSSVSVSGCCAMTAGADIAWVVVWVVVDMPVMLCDRSLFAIAKNGVCVVGVIGARGSFSTAGLLWMVVLRGSCSDSDSLWFVWLGTSMS